MRWAYPLSAFVSVLAAINGLGTFTVGNTPEKTVLLMLVMTGAGFILFSRRQLWAVLAFTFAGWAWFARAADYGPGWPYFGFALLGAAVMASLFQRLRLQSFRAMLRETPVGAAAPASPAPAAPIPEAMTNQGDERFRRWYEATFEGIGIHKKGIILEANQPLAALLARPPGELIGKNLLDWFTRASRDLIEKSILLGNYRPFEAVACRADKTELHLELYTKQISYQGKTVRVSALRDITERKRAARP